MSGGALKQACFRALACALALISVTLLLEIILSLIMPPTFVHWTPNNDLVRDHIPGIHARDVTPEYAVDYIINSQGNRGTLANESQEKQIVVIGDSMTFGWAVQEEQTFAHILEEMTGLPVINLGMGGTEPEQIYKRLVIKSQELNLKPAVIVYTINFNDLGYTGHSDLLEYDYNQKTVRWKQFKKPPLFDLRAFLSRNSEIYNLLYTIKTRSKLADFFGPQRGELPPAISTGIGEHLQSRIDKADVLLSLMKEFAASHSSELVLVYAPGKYEVDDNAFSEVMEKYAVPEAMLGKGPLRETWQGLARRNNLTFLDPTEGMRAENVNNPLYLTTDMHWNGGGHRYIARQIYQEIQPLVS